MTELLRSRVEQARRELVSEGATDGGGEPRRFELFHAASSICSQKVRAVLAHHRLPYTSHTLNIFLGQTYLPDYVRLRMLGCERYGGALASRHDGNTSAAAGGCDGAVVPTLIDWEIGEALVDSKRICLYLDDQMPEATKLRPLRLATSIDEDLNIVDTLPNYQMLMGRAVSGDESSTTRDGVGAALSLKKVALCDRYLAEYADDPILVAAYTAKRTKELSAADTLFSAEAMRAAYESAENALEELNQKLGRQPGRWLYGDDLTMSDLFWGIELLRMKNVGVAYIWEESRLPDVERYFAALEQISAIRTAVIDWPGAMF